MKTRHSPGGVLKLLERNHYPSPTARYPMAKPTRIKTTAPMTMVATMISFRPRLLNSILFFIDSILQPPRWFDCCYAGNPYSR
jgi:hypothetical protein